MDRSGTPKFIDDEDLDELDPEFSAKGSVMGRILIALIILPSFAIWGFAYSGLAERDKPDLLDQPTFALAAGPICDAAMTEYDTLPRPIDAIDHIDRAHQIQASNVVLAQMVNELEAATAGSARDIDIIGEWITDWRTFITDRDEYASRSRLDPDARFYLTSVEGERLERRIPRFATTNGIDSCGSPNDIG